MSDFVKQKKKKTKSISYKGMKYKKMKKDESLTIMTNRSTAQLLNTTSSKGTVNTFHDKPQKKFPKDKNHSRGPI